MENNTRYINVAKENARRNAERAATSKTRPEWYTFIEMWIWQLRQVQVVLPTFYTHAFTCIKLEIRKLLTEYSPLRRQKMSKWWKKMQNIPSWITSYDWINLMSVLVCNISGGRVKGAVVMCRLPVATARLWGPQLELWTPITYGSCLGTGQTGLLFRSTLIYDANRRWNNHQKINYKLWEW